MSYLRSLLQAVGHDDFRTARHEYGLTQRQAGGKFSSKEASALIDRLLGNEPSPTTSGDDHRSGAATRDDGADDPRAGLVRGIPADVLADELVRRGWSVSPPS
jgi:hypothetical protein